MLSCDTAPLGAWNRLMHGYYSFAAAATYVDEIVMAAAKSARSYSMVFAACLLLTLLLCAMNPHPILHSRGSTSQSKPTLMKGSRRKAGHERSQTTELFEEYESQTCTHQAKTYTCDVYIRM